MSTLDAASAARLRAAHPLLQKLFDAVAARTPIVILESQRGRADQEKAFKAGTSKAHFGDSAHNWSPSVALDVAPKPLEWNNRDAFIALSVIVFEEARRLKIQIRWGGDWNMDGKKTTSDAWDLPHYELHPWRDVAKRDCVLYGETPKAQPPAPVAAKVKKLLRIGSTGADVFTLQRRLAALSYYRAQIDGDFGTRTEAAVIDFQVERGLEPDGKVGSVTRKALGI